MKNLTIEQFLGWAFTQELCKIGSGGSESSGLSGWGAANEMAELGTIVDRSPNYYGVIPDFITTSDPHPDAVLAGDAVRDLAKRGIDDAAGWQPFPEWLDEHGLIAVNGRREVRVFGAELPTEAFRQ